MFVEFCCESSLFLFQFISTQVPLHDGLAQAARVEQGDPLFVVDPERYRLALFQARAELEHRRLESKLRSDEASRRDRLGRAVSAEEREEATSLADVARADLQAAQAALQTTPFSRRRRRPRSGDVGGAGIRHPWTLYHKR